MISRRGKGWNKAKGSTEVRTAVLEALFKLNSNNNDGVEDDMAVSGEKDDERKQIDDEDEEVNIRLADVDFPLRSPRDLETGESGEKQATAAAIMDNGSPLFSFSLLNSQHHRPFPPPSNATTATTTGAAASSASSSSDSESHHAPKFSNNDWRTSKNEHCLLGRKNRNLNVYHSPRNSGDKLMSGASSSSAAIFAIPDSDAPAIILPSRSKIELTQNLEKLVLPVSSPPSFPPPTSPWSSFSSLSPTSSSTQPNNNDTNLNSVSNNKPQFLSQSSSSATLRGLSFSSLSSATSSSTPSNTVLLQLQHSEHQQQFSSRSPRAGRRAVVVSAAINSPRNDNNTTTTPSSSFQNQGEERRR